MATTVKELVATFGLQTDKASFDKGQQAVDGIKTAAKAMAALFVTGAFAKGIQSLVERASNAAESMNVIDSVFGENKKSILDWAATTAAAVGRSEFALRDMAATTGSLVQPMLGSRKAAADMSKQVAELAVDLGSFFNATDEDALRALRAGLIGQTEPLLRFGVNLQSATLEQFALSKGITKSIDSMTLAEKTNLRFQAILAQTKNAQGDAAKTSEGYANATKALKAGIQDLSTRLGQALLPAAERGVRSMRNIVKAVTAWFRANEEVIKGKIDAFLQRLGQVIESVGAMFMRAAEAVKTWFDGLDETQMMMLKIAGVAAALAAILMLPGGSILLLIGLVALLIDDFETWRKGGKSVIGDLLGSYDELIAGHETVIESVRFIGAVFTSVFTAIQDLIFSFIQFAVDAFDVGFVQALENLLTNLLESGFGQFLSDAGDAISTAASYWYDILVTAWNDATNAMAMSFPGVYAALEMVGTIFMSVLTAIKDYWFTWIQFIIDLFDVGFIQAIKNLLRNLWEFGFGKLLSEIGSAISVAAKYWGTLIWDALTGAFKRIAKYVEENTIIGKVIAKVAGAAGTLAGGGTVGEAVSTLTGGRSDAVLASVGALTNGTLAGPVIPRTGAGAGFISNQQTSNVSVSVQAGPGMDEAQLAQLVADKVNAIQEEQNRTALDALTVGAGT